MADEEYHEDIETVMNLGPCWHCNKKTRLVEINFMVYLCSKECYDAKWEEYLEVEHKMRRESYGG